MVILRFHQKLQNHMALIDASAVRCVEFVFQTTRVSAITELQEVLVADVQLRTT